jgi:Flp pilus assembly protein TadD
LRIVELIMNVHRIILWPAALLIVFPAPTLSQMDEQADFDRGVVLRIERKHREAAAAFARSLAAAPGNATALVQMGASLEDMGKWKDAEQAYRRALEVDPENTAAERNLENLLNFRRVSTVSRGPGASEEILVKQGFRALDLKDLDEALRRFGLLQGLLPDDPRPMLYAAVAWERCGDKQQAQALYRQTVKAFPSSPTARVHLVLLLLESGDRENATKEVRAALQAMPQDHRIRYLARTLGAAMRVSEDSASPLPPPGTWPP